MYFKLKPTTKTSIKHVFKHRLAKDSTNLDEESMYNLINNNKDYFRIMYYKDTTIIGILGLLPSENYFNGYLVLTEQYKVCSISWIKETKKFLTALPKPIRFKKHHDVDLINKWYGLLGFQLEGSYWIRR